MFINISRKLNQLRENDTEIVRLLREHRGVVAEHQQVVEELKIALDELLKDDLSPREH